MTTDSQYTTRIHINVMRPLTLKESLILKVPRDGHESQTHVCLFQVQIAPCWRWKQGQGGGRESNCDSGRWADIQGGHVAIFGGENGGRARSQPYPSNSQTSTTTSLLALLCKAYCSPPCHKSPVTTFVCSSALHIHQYQWSYYGPLLHWTHVCFTAALFRGLYPKPQIPCGLHLGIQGNMNSPSQTPYGLHMD